MAIRAVVLLVAAMAVALLLSACRGTQKPGKLHKASQSVDVGNAQSVHTTLKIGAGELNVTGGADQLMEGDFSYNVAAWKPKVNYDVSGDTGKLSVRQGEGSKGPSIGNARNEWDLRLNDEIPTDLDVRMGAGESDLDLDSLALKGLDLKMGAGKTTVDLAGDYGQSFDASIEGGVGEATVRLPSKVGVKVNAEGGIGKINADGLRREGQAYVNDAYSNSDVTLNVNVRSGVGQIKLEVV
jgi:N-terminal domain of toast_rack, DUF2154